MASGLPTGRYKKNARQSAATRRKEALEFAVHTPVVNRNQNMAARIALGNIITGTKHVLHVMTIVGMMVTLSTNSNPAKKHILFVSGFVLQ